MAQITLQQSPQFSKTFAHQAIETGTTLADLKTSEQTILLKAQPGTSYRVVDPITGQIQTVKKILRKNRDLSVELETGTTIELQDFFAATNTQTTPEALSEFVLQTGDTGCPYSQVASDAPVGADASGEATIWEPGTASAMCIPVMATAAAASATVSAASSLVGAAAGMSTGGLMGALALGAASLGGGGGSSAAPASPKAQALDAIQKATQDNSAAQLTPSQYTDAGVTGVTSDNVAAINSALNTGELTKTQVDTTAKIQTIVDAYNAILAEANGSATDATSTNPTQADYTAIGVPNGTLAAAGSADLLNNIIGDKTTADVDTVAEITALADLAQSIQAVAQGSNTAVPTASFSTLGITGVTDDNITALNNLIRAQADDGTGTDTVAELQALVNNMNTALVNLSAIAQANSATSSGPTLSDYAQAGMTGVTADNLAAINEILNTGSINGTATDTAVKIQNSISSYNKIEAEANATGANPNGSQWLTVQDFANVGVSIGSGNARYLLNNTIANKTVADVNTVAEIAELARISEAVVAKSSGTGTLTSADLTTLGITNAAEANMALMNEVVARSIDGGTQVNTLSAVQTYMNKINVIVEEANGSAADSTLANPAYADYLTAMTIGYVTNTPAFVNLMNDVVGTKTTSQIDTTAELQALGTAVKKIAPVVNGTTNYILTSDLQALGVVTNYDSTTNLRFYVARMFANEADDGSTTDSVAELQAHLDGWMTAQTNIQAAAEANNASSAITYATYAKTGMTGVVEANVAAYNSALDSTSVHSYSVDSLEGELQAMVSSYNNILTIANGSADDAGVGYTPTSSNYSAIGVTGFLNPDNVVRITSTISVNLLNDIIRNKTADQVDTVDEIDALASAGMRILRQSTYYHLSPQVEDFAKIGISGVTASNFTAVLNAIDATANDGSGVDTLAEIQAVINPVL